MFLTSNAYRRNKLGRDSKQILKRRPAGCAVNVKSQEPLTVFFYVHSRVKSPPPGVTFVQLQLPTLEDGHRV